MSDFSELKRLAEAAPEGPWFGPEYAPHTSHVFDVDLGTLLEYQSIDTEKDACLRYVAAANPAAVLDLIAEVERGQRMLLAACVSLGGIGEALGADMDDDADHLIGMISDLKAENERSEQHRNLQQDTIVSLRTEMAALRKDAERWRAFVNCARIKFFGWAGYGEKDAYGNSPGNYRHFGGEFWTLHDAPTADKAKAAEILNGFADAAVAATNKEASHG